MFAVRVKRGLVPRWVLMLRTSMLLLQSHGRSGVSLLAVVEVCAAAHVSPRRGDVLMAEWLWLGADLTALA